MLLEICFPQNICLLNCYSAQSLIQLSKIQEDFSFLSNKLHTTDILELQSGIIYSEIVWNVKLDILCIYS